MAHYIVFFRVIIKGMSNTTDIEKTVEHNKNYLLVVTQGSGPGSAVGIATGYGLDGPGIESR
jgi:hypothetical protein